MSVTSPFSADSGLNPGSQTGMNDQKTATLLPRIPAPDPNPQLRGQTTYFNDHPFFYFWINGKIMRALGPSSWSARVLTASFSTGCVVLTVILGSLLYSPLFGFLSGLFLLFSRDVILTGATVSLDPALMFFILLSFVFWIKEKWLWVGLSAGVGLWFKTPVVLLVYPTAFLLSILRGRLQQDIKKLFISLGISLCVGSAVWIVTGLLGGWKLVTDYWIRQLWGSAIHGRNLSTRPDLWAPYRILFRGFIPGFPFLFAALGLIAWKKHWKNDAVRVPAIAIAILLATITPLQFRLDYYYNPVFPFLAILSSFSLIELVRPIEKKFYLGFSAFVSILLAFLLCTPTTLGPEAFVALKRFIPFIQTYGKCEDEVMIVGGGEPIGSSLDSSLVLRFYTGRNIFSERCEAAGNSIRKRPPEWIVLSKENLERCLSPQDRTNYPFQFQVGQQYLLTRMIPTTQPIDLTPLDRELMPVIDCKPQPYPKDIYHRY
jgi:hypothetical protein